jgi:hypothetical protein
VSAATTGSIASFGAHAGSSERQLSEGRPTDITGSLCLYRDRQQPLVITLSDGAGPFVAVFTDRERLARYVEAIGLTAHVVKLVTDGRDFADSLVSQGVRIMLNPRQEGDRTRWTEIVAVGGASA